MCRVLYLSNKAIRSTGDKVLLKWLKEKAETHGGDGYGIGGLVKGDGFRVLKGPRVRPRDIVKFLRTESWENGALVHIRAASSGDGDANHPFASRDWILIHNGHSVLLDNALWVVNELGVKARSDTHLALILLQHWTDEYGDPWYALKRFAETFMPDGTWIIQHVSGTVYGVGNMGWRYRYDPYTRQASVYRGWTYPLVVHKNPVIMASERIRYRKGWFEGNGWIWVYDGRELVSYAPENVRWEDWVY